VTLAARLAVALAAAGRAALIPTLGVIVAASLPLLVVDATLGAIRLPGATVAAVLYLAVALPVSVVVHESAHAIAYALLFDRRAGEFVIAGRVTRGMPELVRAPLASEGSEAVVALAGPLAGAALCLPLAIVTATPWIWMTPFFAHLVSLLPRSADGAQVAAALTHRRIDARRR
jgi:hypothetical protein